MNKIQKSVYIFGYACFFLSLSWLPLMAQSVPDNGLSGREFEGVDASLFDGGQEFPSPEGSYQDMQGGGSVPSASIEKTTTSVRSIEKGLASHLRILNKNTARVFEVELLPRQKTTFETLEITAFDCQKTITPQGIISATFIDVIEKEKQTEKRLFKGWIYADAPSLITFDHPSFDVWLQNCKTVSAEQ